MGTWEWGRARSCAWIVGALAMVAAHSTAARAQGPYTQGPYTQGPYTQGPSIQSGAVRHAPGSSILTAQLGPGDELVVGTCGMPGAWFQGDTTLELRGPSGRRVAFNDDDCGGLGSRLRFVVPPGGQGTYVVMAGCYQQGTCSGLAAWQVVPAAGAVMSDGASVPGDPPSSDRAGLLTHVPGTTVLRIALAAGQRLVAGHCGFPGAGHQGDTTLRVYGPSGESVAFDDDGCGSLGSRVVAAAARDGVYSLEAGCYSQGTDCGGTLGYRVEDGPPPPPPVRVVTAVRGVVALGVDAGALVADGLVEVHVLPNIALRLAGAPLGLGGGELGGIATGTLHLSAVWDTGAVAVGIGGGVSVLASRFGGLAQREAAVFVPSVRFGRLSSFHIEGQIAVAFLTNVEVMSLNVAMRVPTRDVDFVLRAAAGNDGVVLGEAALVFWVLSRPRQGPVLGVSVHAGGGAVFYEPLCRIGGTCAQAHWYAGPLAGVGLEWRP